MGSQITCLLGRRCAPIHLQNHMKTIAHLPYLPDLALVDFFLFLEVKNGAGWQEPDPGHRQKQLGWGHQEAEQRRHHHRLGEAHCKKCI